MKLSQWKEIIKSPMWAWENVLCGMQWKSIRRFDRSFRRRAGICKKDLPRRYLSTSHISGAESRWGRSCGRVSSERRERQRLRRSGRGYTRRRHNATHSRKSAEPLLSPPPLSGASDRSQLSGAISREAIWHAVVLAWACVYVCTRMCVTYDEDLNEGAFERMIRAPRAASIVAL